LLHQKGQLRQFFVERTLHLTNLILQNRDIALQLNDLFACTEAEAGTQANKGSEPGKSHHDAPE
jgi:hypothetical protein